MMSFSFFKSVRAGVCVCVCRNYQTHQTTRTRWTREMKRIESENKGSCNPTQCPVVRDDGLPPAVSGQLLSIFKVKTSAEKQNICIVLSCPWTSLLGRAFYFPVLLVIWGCLLARENRCSERFVPRRNAAPSVRSWLKSFLFLSTFRLCSGLDWGSKTGATVVWYLLMWPRLGDTAGGVFSCVLSAMLGRSETENCCIKATESR